MIIENESEIAKITKKLNTFFDFDRYSDLLFLTFEEFVSKYESYGFGFADFITVRFEAEADALAEICDFLPENEHYFILLKNGTRNYYKVEKSQSLLF